MRVDLESAIRDLLYIGHSPAQVVDRVAARLKENGGTRPERRAFLNLLIQSGQHRQAYELIGHWMNDKERVPWKEFLFILRSAGYRPSKEFFDYFFTAMAQVDPKDKVEIFEAWTHLDPRFESLKASYLIQLQNDAKSREKRLFEKLEYFRNHRMLNEEERLLDEMVLRFPDNENLRKEKENFRSRWAHHLISEKSRALSHKERVHKATQLNSEEWKFADHLYLVMQEQLGRHPQMAYDFSLGLFMMELYHHAVQMIRLSTPNLATDWFRLEILLKARRFLECLQDISEVEHKYADDPESTFAATYLRAQVLYGLGQAGKAINLIESILQVRPSYRSAHALAMEWRNT